VTIGTDGKLSVDEETFKKADMTVAKSLFNSTGSYAYQIGTKASMINSAVVTQSSGSAYTSTGALSTSSLINSYNSYV
jgi:hypothetical protein